MSGFGFDTSKIDRLGAAEDDAPLVTYKQSSCSRCGCNVVVREDSVRPLCMDCGRTERMERRQGSERV
jgi:ribosomal protein S27AE